MCVCVLGFYFDCISNQERKGVSSYTTTNNNKKSRNVEENKRRCVCCCAYGNECMLYYLQKPFAPDNVALINILHDLASFTFVWEMLYGGPCVPSGFHSIFRPFAPLLITATRFSLLARKAHTRTYPHTLNTRDREKNSAKKLGRKNANIL